MGPPWSGSGVRLSAESGENQGYLGWSKKLRDATCSCGKFVGHCRNAGTIRDGVTQRVAVSVGREKILERQVRRETALAFLHGLRYFDLPTILAITSSMQAAACGAKSPAGLFVVTELGMGGF
jgi:hypothetical protein